MIALKNEEYDLIFRNELVQSGDSDTIYVPCKYIYGCGETK